MLTERENDRLSRVGPGTPMGNMLRRYWHPVATVPDLDREKVLALRILGEDLALYRSDRGEPGLVQQRCPHRSASLAYGIPDEDGIRCPYHGWYFNKAGQCLAQPYDDTESAVRTRQAWSVTRPRTIRCSPIVARRTLGWPVPPSRSPAAECRGRRNAQARTAMAWHRRRRSLRRAASPQ